MSKENEMKILIYFIQNLDYNIRQDDEYIQKS